MPNVSSAIMAAIVLVCGLAGLIAGGEWRWLAVPSCLFLGLTILWSLSGWRQSAEQLSQTERHLLDLVDFPTLSPFLTDAEGGSLYRGSLWTTWTGQEEDRAGVRWLEAVHPDDQDAIGLAWSEALGSGKPYDCEYRVRFRSGDYRWLRARAFPSHDDNGEVTHWAGILEDVHDRRTAEEQLRQTATLLELIGASTDTIIYAKDRDGRMLYLNRALEQLSGLHKEDILGRTDDEWNRNSAEAEALKAADRQVIETGHTLDLEEMFTGQDGQSRYYQTLKSPLRDHTGEVIGVVGVSTDISAAKEAEQREKLLSRELDHRAKNLLAVVQSVVSLTRADTLVDFKKAVEGRIQSLGRAHSMLAASRWEGAELERVLSEELAPYRGAEQGQVILSGPPMLLKPAAAQSLALVFHELATNAVKYGALSVAGGELEVRWGIEEKAGRSALLRLRWEERGGPSVPPRTSVSRSGFGSRVIRSSIERQLGGSLTLDWAATGLVVTMEVALDRSLHDPDGGMRGGAPQP
ncbi:PAS domain-containing protein [Sphingomonas humi]|uniref:histidine kinase n=1 Tax=Sphingomonas humi TaxID=335630 RepID=A0ABP7RD39_9SPHN